jgi:hypothetical protein
MSSEKVVHDPLDECQPTRPTARNAPIEGPASVASVDPSRIRRGCFIRPDGKRFILAGLLPEKQAIQG